MKNDKVRTGICLDINVKLVDKHEKPFFAIVFADRLDADKIGQNFGTKLDKLFDILVIFLKDANFKTTNRKNMGNYLVRMSLYTGHGQQKKFTFEGYQILYSSIGTHLRHISALEGYVFF